MIPKDIPSAWFTWLVGAVLVVSVGYIAYTEFQPESLSEWAAVALAPVFAGLLAGFIGAIKRRDVMAQRKFTATLRARVEALAENAARAKLNDLLVHETDPDRVEWLRQALASWGDAAERRESDGADSAPSEYRLNTKAAEADGAGSSTLVTGAARGSYAHTGSATGAVAPDPVTFGRDLDETVRAAAVAAAAAVQQQVPRLSVLVSLAWVVILGGLLGGLGVWLLLTEADDLARGAGASLAGAAAAFVLRDVHDIVRGK